jgi:1-phosphofructokinase
MVSPGRGYATAMKLPDEEAARPRVCVFSPSPLLMVSIEKKGYERPDVHVHAGGQGPWIANMLTVLEAQAVLCGPFGGETGRVLHDLLGRELAVVRSVEAAGSNGCMVEDRRSGEPSCLVDMPPAALDRHENDDLYNQALAAGLDARVTVLSGPGSAEAVSPDIYRRLASDLSGLGATVVADLSGQPLSTALEGGVSVLKVSHEDLVADGRARSGSPADLTVALEELSAHVRTLVVLTRAGEPSLALLDGQVLEVQVPRLQPVDHRGAGDSLTAGVAAALAHGAGPEDALRVGAAAGAVNVTRHGLASGQRHTIEQLADRVVIQPLKPSEGDSP